MVAADLEQAELPAAHYDLCVAATSWHWVDPEAAVPKTAGLLRPSGGLVIWWTIFGDPDRKHTEFRSALDPLYLRYLPGEVDDGRPPKPLRADEWREHLQAGGWFEPPGMELFRWTQHLTAASACALWATFPNVAGLPTSDRDGFLAGVADAVEAAGGIVDDPRLTVVYHTRRRWPVGS